MLKKPNSKFLKKIPMLLSLLQSSYLKSRIILNLRFLAIPFPIFLIIRFTLLGDASEQSNYAII